MANNSLTNYQMYKLALVEPIRSTGLIGENPTFIITTNNTLVVVTESVGATNAISVQARILGQTAFTTIATITGLCSGAQLDVSLYDQVRFDCTTFDSGGAPTLIVSSFFNLGLTLNQKNAIIDNILVYDDGLGDFQVLFDESGNILVYDGA